MYKIIGDSCLDLPKNLKSDPHFVQVPMTIRFSAVQIIDDCSFDQRTFLSQFKNCSNNPQTACPSPMEYLKAFEGEEESLFVITLSSALSGSYNSAIQAKKLYEEEHGENKKDIFVIDSESASAGQSKIAILIYQLCEQDIDMNEIKRRVMSLRDEMKTYFVLKDIDILKKAGRLAGLKDILVNVLNIKFVMGSDKGHIKKLIQERGIQRALQRMCQTVATEVDNLKDKMLVISHINNPARAEYVKRLILKYAVCKDIIIVNGGGISTVYAGDGGIVLAV